MPVTKVAETLVMAVDLTFQARPVKRCRYTGPLVGAN
jgi:hypothetical protein